LSTERALLDYLRSREFDDFSIASVAVVDELQPDSSEATLANDAYFSSAGSDSFAGSLGRFRLRRVLE
jgi:hypothetical protein